MFAWALTTMALNYKHANSEFQHKIVVPQ